MESHAITFRRIAIITICAVYLLIAVGSIVRVTGAGMGCPDWPTCFGRLVPPTDVSQLPPDYKTRFAIQGKEIADFNVVHTWTEYTNRLIGVTIGLLIFLTTVVSIRYWQKDKVITITSIAAFLMVLFEGWLGAKVVEHNLRPLTVTLHFILSLFIVWLLTTAIVRSHVELWRDEDVKADSSLRSWMIGAMLILLVQIVLGTVVRADVDNVSKSMNFMHRDIWLDTIGFPFYIHRSFSILVLAVQALMLRKLYLAARFTSAIITWIFVIGGLFFLEIFSGVIMTYLQMPIFIQPTHVELSALICGIEFMLILRLGLWRSKRLAQSVAAA